MRWHRSDPASRISRSSLAHLAGSSTGIEEGMTPWLPGIVTYPKARQLEDVAQDISGLLIEK